VRKGRPSRHHAERQGGGVSIRAGLSGRLGRRSDSLRSPTANPSAADLKEKGGSIDDLDGGQMRKGGEGENTCYENTTKNRMDTGCCVSERRRPREERSQFSIKQRQGQKAKRGPEGTVDCYQRKDEGTRLADLALENAGQKREGGLLGGRKSVAAMRTRWKVGGGGRL